MDLVLKIGVFLLFLLCYALFFQGSRLAQRWLGRSPFSGATAFAQGAATAIGATGALTVFMFLLARFFSPLLTLLLLAVGFGALILGLVVRGLFGSRGAEVEEFWEGVGVGARSRGLMYVILAIGSVVVFGYPVAVGIVYFTNAIPSAEATLWILRFTLLGLVLGGQLPLLVAGANLLMTETVEDDARTLMLAQRVLALMSTAFLLVLTFWSFSIVEEGGDLSIGGVFADLGLFLVITLVLYFVVTALIPYLIGSRQSFLWRTGFQQDRDRLRRKLLDALGLPETDLKVQRLDEVLREARQEQATMEADQLVVFAERVGNGNIDVEELPKDQRGYTAALVSSYPLFRERDPRFQHLDWLREFTGRVDHIVEEIGSKRTEATVKKVADAWVAYYVKRDEEEKTADKAAAPSKPKTAVVASFLVSTGIVGVLLTKAGEFLSENLTDVMK